MRELKKINQEESIARQRLVFDEGFSDKFNRLIVCITFLPFAMLPAFAFYYWNTINQNELFVRNYILPVLSPFAVYMLYRNATEMRLNKISSDFDAGTIKTRLLEYAMQQELEVVRKSGGCFVFNEPSENFTSNHGKTYVILIREKDVFFTVIQDNYRVNIPTISTHLFFKYDLKRLLKNPKV